MRRRCRQCERSFKTYDWNAMYCSTACKGWASRIAAQPPVVIVDDDEAADRPPGDPTPEEILVLARRLRPPGRKPVGNRRAVFLQECFLIKGGAKSRYQRWQC